MVFIKTVKRLISLTVHVEAKSNSNIQRQKAIQKLVPFYHMSHIMRKPYFCLCENKDADQLHSNCEADQRLCFRYTDSTFFFFLHRKFQASRLLLRLYRPVCIRPGLKPRRPVFLLAHIIEMPADFIVARHNG